MTEIEFTLRMRCAVVLGTVIGLERQWRQRAAGLRTNVLVALGSALFVLLGSMIPGESSPTRMAAQIVSGIGFLGGGVILSSCCARWLRCRARCLYKLGEECL
jgi:putative Mg2+ transporter-C (MgtC) family protein